MSITSHSLLIFQKVFLKYVISLLLKLCISTMSDDQVARDRSMARQNASKISSTHFSIVLIIIWFSDEMLLFFFYSQHNSSCDGIFWCPEETAAPGVDRFACRWPISTSSPGLRLHIPGSSLLQMCIRSIEEDAA